jgi:SAM-dependent methyltransferase
MNGLFNQSEGINYRSIKKLISRLWDSFQGEALEAFGDEHANYSGQVIIYNQDLTDLVDIQDKSVDAIVAVSSLEHNSPENLEQVVSELQRVLKPGRPMYATLACAKDKDWYHESSQGWCYNEQTLRRIFDLKDDIPTNFDHKELKEDLASFYFRSGDNGMPWGKWDPQYQPVGICKIKQEEEVGEG